MDPSETNLAGVFHCVSDSDWDRSGGWTNTKTIFIYHEESYQLCYNFLLEEEDNYSRALIFEEGLVRLEAAGREVHFEVRQRYEWSAGGGMGYDISGYRRFTYGPQEYIDSFRVLDQAELASLREKLLVDDQTNLAIASRKESMYVRIGGKGGSWYKSAEVLKDEVVLTREKLHKQWQHMTREYVFMQLARGMDPEEIAARCDWAVSAIRALEQRSSNSGTP